jgi:hypothetical protein
MAFDSTKPAKIGYNAFMVEYLSELHGQKNPTALRRGEQSRQKLTVGSLEAVTGDMLLLRELYAFHKERKRWPLAHEMFDAFPAKGLGDRYTVSRAEDVLTDMGILDVVNVTLEDGSGGNGFSICEHFDGFAKFVFERTEGIPVR